MEHLNVDMGTFILKDGEDYYLTFSSFESYPGLLIWHSRDLVNWTPLTTALKQHIGIVWALENPRAGVVEADEMDYRRCLEVQMPYLGPVKGYYTDWTPLENRPGLFREDIDTKDPWQFRNILVR